MSFFGLTFGSSADIHIALKNQQNLPKTEVKNHKGEIEHLYVFSGNDTLAGDVVISLKRGQSLQHIGIKVELIGQIEMLADRSNPYEFTSLVKELEPPGELYTDKRYKFSFPEIEKQYETYNGLNVLLRYFLRVKISRQYNTNITKTLDFAVQNLQVAPEINSSIKMEVGIEDCLHIEFEYQKKKYNLNDVVIGKIYFLLVRIKIKHMEIVIVKRENTNHISGADQSENIAKFEIMDGAPVRGETIPVRLYLAPYNLSPTYRSVHNKYSVKYFLNLVLVDEEERRYFKQHEITLWRKDLDLVKATGK